MKPRHGLVLWVVRVRGAVCACAMRSVRVVKAGGRGGGRDIGRAGSADVGIDSLHRYFLFVLYEFFIKRHAGLFRLTESYYCDLNQRALHNENMLVVF